jgi:hypothetical protein
MGIHGAIPIDPANRARRSAARILTSDNTAVTDSFSSVKTPSFIKKGRAELFRGCLEKKAVHVGFERSRESARPDGLWLVRFEHGANSPAPKTELAANLFLLANSLPPFLLSPKKVLTACQVTLMPVSYRHCHNSTAVQGENLQLIYSEHNNGCTTPRTGPKFPCSVQPSKLGRAACRTGG